eukprot:Em0005g833a
MTGVVVVSRLLTEYLEFDVHHSHLLSYGIDLQCHEKLRERSLGPVAAADARIVADTLLEVGAFQPNNVAIFTAAQDPGECGYDGIKRNFVKLAGAAGESGLFVFHFTGHTFQLKGGQWALAPSDYDGKPSNCITARALGEWLTEAGCRAKHVLLTLDCCGGEGTVGIADAVTTTDVAHPSLYVMSAVTANEASHVAEALGNSPFSYFLSRAVKKHTPSRPSAPTFNFPLRKIFDECRQGSVALSTLLVRCEGKGRRLGLVTSPLAPDLQWFEYQSIVFKGAKHDSVDEIDSPAVVVGRFEPLARHYNPRRPASLHVSTTAWLDSLSNHDSPLSLLRDKGLLRDDRALDAALCSMAYSVASLQLACDPASVREPNLFVTGAMEVMGAMDAAVRRVTMGRRTVELCGRFYREALLRQGVDVTLLDELLLRVDGGFDGEQESSLKTKVKGLVFCILCVEVSGNDLVSV